MKRRRYCSPDEVRNCPSPVAMKRTCSVSGVECVRVGRADAERHLLVIAELTNEADVTNLVDATVKQFGRLDILVNSAGINHWETIETTSMEQYDRMMNVNVRSVFHLTILCVPHLIAARGSIVNVSSVAGTRSFPGLLVYCMSKSAVDQLTACAALELASKGVRVNSVNQGVTFTDLHKRAGMSDEESEKFMERTKDTHPLGRPVNAEEVAEAIAFLTSSSSSFITGEHLHVDGGWHAFTPV